MSETLKRFGHKNKAIASLNTTFTNGFSYARGF